MSTCFMLMNNPIDLVMDLVVNPINTNHHTSLEGAIEKYKVDFDVVSKQTVFTFKLFDDVKLYKLRIVADMDKRFVDFSATEHFFNIINILGLAINTAKSNKQALAIKVDMHNSHVYLTKLGANGGVHMFHGWLEE
ncbi:MAG: hypothetical protein KHY11_00565 [Veillonella sp.]|uniref:hypothetical protein n=1 Tax=Veillonella sp. TaxID=1926307 RepID=UPI0025DD8E7E|nr:hypothetical protein [Veillonella sp.]MBS5335973.1 hypothetical protein [Veillonella sp.]